MKKNIIILLLALANVASLLYAYRQQVHSEQYKELADKQSLLEEKLMTQLQMATQEALRQRAVAEQQMHLAVQNEAKAVKQMKLAKENERMALIEREHALQAQKLKK
jgi:hypothetical protein